MRYSLKIMLRRLNIWAIKVKRLATATRLATMRQKQYEMVNVRLLL
jgi:hypothetical protein